MKPCLAMGYFTGTQGLSLVFFYFGNGVIAGWDVGNGEYRGSYELNDDGIYSISIEIFIPAGTATITGLRASQEMTIPYVLTAPQDFLSGKILRLESPMGLINARFEKKFEIPL